ncbi:MAG: NAD(P)/FAD-dependent oxidoreductase [Candidatus Omnitrophica bacterium]|nr:NAD(P)/FAD-dependent oxidoreductase [Candidatus Omnitrophota bacterium]
MSQNQVIVIGAGPAGMMSAISASQFGANVILVEKNAVLGRKLLFTGKGRCNLTNRCSFDEFLERFSKNNGQFLRDAFKVLFNEELIEFFEKRGLQMKTERQQRVFPETDKSSSVVRVLSEELRKKNIKIRFSTIVKNIWINGKGCVAGVALSDGKKIESSKVILATGGASYQFTGSTGEGFKFAERLGHKIVPLRPGLVALETTQKEIKALSGVTLRNIRIYFVSGKKEIASSVGELLFTEFGVSGPIILSMSGIVVDWIQEGRKVFVEVDFKPALAFEQLDARFLKNFKDSPKKNIKNVLKDFLPQRLIDIFLEKSNILPDKRANQITPKEREKLILLFKRFPIEIKESLPMEEAMVTRGGISLKDINPRTMESKRVKGLYFAGEIIDVDGDTGGFNLQAAFSTGYLAGKSAAIS